MMAPDEAMPHTQTDHQHTWRTLIEFDLSAEPGVEQLAVDRIADAMRRLNWPAAQLRQLKLALAQAARNAAECNCWYDSERVLAIRVLIPENDQAGRDIDQVLGASTPPQAPEAKTQRTTQSAFRGWGFFIIEKAVPSPDLRNVRYLIELYLYPEGAKRDPDRR